MKLYGIKDNEDELYFHIEKTKEALELIDNISKILFSKESWHFENHWQTGLPEKEDYYNFEKDGIYMGVTISKERVHIVIKGFPKDSTDKQHIKKILMKQYSMIEPPKEVKLKKIKIKKIPKKKIIEILKKKGFNTKIGWFYTQFNKFYEEGYIINKINLKNAARNLVNFLNKKEIKEVLFFPELSFEMDMPYASVKTKELEKFLIENVTLSTNSHVSDTDLNWIFTITHEEDFFISGSKKIVKEIISFFKSAKCIKYKDLKAK